MQTRDKKWHWSVSSKICERNAAHIYILDMKLKLNFMDWPETAHCTKDIGITNKLTKGNTM